LKAQLETYLQSQWGEYFSPTMYAQKGWSEGAWREDMDYPPDLQDCVTTLNKSLTCNSAWGWSYPQANFYAMWKYAQIFPSEITNAYNLAKSKITLPPMSSDCDDAGAAMDNARLHRGLLRLPAVADPSRPGRRHRQRLDEGADTE
jgi:hypothetical protein